MRCPDCNRFVAYNQDDPEVELEVTSEGVTGDVRIVLTCEQCGTELKESTFEVSTDDDLTGHEGDEHELDVEADAEPTTRTEGHGRGTKTFYGYHMTYKVTCSCTPGQPVLSEEWGDDVQASSMDELT